MFGRVPSGAPRHGVQVKLDDLAIQHPAWLAAATVPDVAPQPRVATRPRVAASTFRLAMVRGRAGRHDCRMGGATCSLDARWLRLWVIGRA